MSLLELNFGMTGIDELGRILNGDKREVSILVGGCTTPAVVREELETLTGD